MYKVLDNYIASCFAFYPSQKSDSSKLDKKCLIAIKRLSDGLDGTSAKVSVCHSHPTTSEETTLIYDRFLYTTIYK